MFEDLDTEIFPFENILHTPEQVQIKWRQIWRIRRFLHAVNHSNIKPRVNVYKGRLNTFNMSYGAVVNFNKGLNFVVVTHHKIILNVISRVELDTICGYSKIKRNFKQGYHKIQHKMCKRFIYLIAYFGNVKILMFGF